MKRLMLTVIALLVVFTFIRAWSGQTDGTVKAAGAGYESALTEHR